VRCRLKLRKKKFTKKGRWGRGQKGKGKEKKRDEGVGRPEGKGKLPYRQLFFHFDLCARQIMRKYPCRSRALQNI